MSCKNNTPNVNKTFIIEPLVLTGGTPVLSACTSMYTNLIQSCSGDTTITLGTGLEHLIVILTVFNQSRQLRLKPQLIYLVEQIYLI